MTSIVVTANNIRLLSLLRPNTHEIGGVITLADTNEILDIKTVQGTKCRDANGQLLGTNKKCSVTHPHGTIVYHTHPRANRPSSTDLIVAVQNYLQHKQKINILVTPLGVWFYAPNPSYAHKFATYSTSLQNRDLKTLRFLGHMEQKNTQRENCSSYIQELQKIGFNVEYISYKDVIHSRIWNITV